MKLSHYFCQGGDKMPFSIAGSFWCDTVAHSSNAQYLRQDLGPISAHAAHV